jgi:hypothetical protein
MVAHQDPGNEMKSVIDEYDAYLRRKAQQPARRRLYAFRWVLLPWAIAAFFVEICLRTFGVAPWLVLPPLVVILLGLGWAGARFINHGVEFDRTPPSAPWTATEEGQALIRTLRRVTLNSLSEVTLETRLREDLKLTSGDLSELFALLREEGGVDGGVVQRGQSGGLAVGELLKSMQAGASQGPDVQTIA